MKISTRIVSLVLAFFICVTAFTVPAKAAGGEIIQGIAFVNATALRLRSEPNTAARTLDYAPKGDVVVVLEKVGDWYKVNYNLQTGYMSGKYLTYTVRENAELGYGRINGTRVNIRSGPSTGHTVLTQAGIGDKAYIIGINNQWLKIIYGNRIGYVRSDFMDLTEIPYENADSKTSPLFFRGGKSTGIKPSAEALNGSSIRERIVATAKQYIGVPYLWAGTTPRGFDCSGYVQYVFAQHGISLPRTSKQQWTAGVEISREELQPGDLVFFANTYTSGVSHLGIYIGNNQFIHSSSSKGVTVTSMDNTYWASHYFGARRVL